MKGERREERGERREVEAIEVIPAEAGIQDLPGSPFSRG